MRLFALLVFMLVPAASAVGQIIGTVSDDMTRKRIAGAAVIPLDAAGKATGRFATDLTGTFRITVSGTKRLRVIKLGFRPREFAVRSEADTIAIVMERLPNLLEPVRTSDQPRCGRNSTRPAALGLWEQARAALLGEVIAREANTAQVTRINFRRYMEPDGKRIARQSVKRETGLSLRSFDAVFSAEDFAKNGFARPDSDAVLSFYGPDAEVLLDEAFPALYCLQLADAQKARPREVGLRFRPMQRQTGRVDLDGTLWIDTSARVLKDIEFIYLGLEPWADPFKPGGRIAFNELSEGALWIDRWWLRLVGARIASGGRQRFSVLRTSLVEAGAELDAVYWPDGRQWRASLGSAELLVTRSDGRPYPAARISLADTDYGDVADSSGHASIGRLLPGPYSVVAYDSVLAVIDTTAPTGVRFVAERDSVFRATVVVPSAEDVIKIGCVDRQSYTPGSYMLAARLLSESGTSMTRANWILERKTDDPLEKNKIAEGSTGSDGLVLFCTEFIADMKVVLRVWPPGKTIKDSPGQSVPLTLKNPVTTTLVIVRPQ